MIEDILKECVDIYPDISPCAGFYDRYDKTVIQNDLCIRIHISYQIDVTSKMKQLEWFESLRIVIRPRYGLIC